MKKQRFDYNKEGVDDIEYHGFHKRNGRYHIDTKRLTKLGIANYFPRALFEKSRNTHYFVPKRKCIRDYYVNALMGCVDTLTNDWHNEYKTAIEKIKTPSEVENEKIIDSISGEWDSECFEEVYAEATIAAALRLPKYEEVIRGMHLQYLQKMYIDYFRRVVVLLRKYGFNSDEYFVLKDVIAFVNRTVCEEGALQKLPHYKYFALLNHIDNFLKHNSRSTYEALANSKREDEADFKDFLASYVYKETRGREYEDGMYSGYWLNISPSFVDEMLGNLREFTKEFCKLVFDEDYEEAVWNSDEALFNIIKKVIKDYC